jgi:hypothetical protein
MCRVRHGDGFDDLILVRQTPVAAVGAIPWMNYMVYVHAPSGASTGDLKSVKAILHSVHFFRPAE